MDGTEVNGDIEDAKTRPINGQDETNGNITQPVKDGSKLKQNNGDCKTNEGKNQNGNKQKGKCLKRLTIVNIFLSLSSVSLGIAVVVEGRMLSHWVVKSAFGIWYGFLIFVTSIIGISTVNSKSKMKAIAHILLNTVTMIVTIISLACYGTAIIYYKHLTNQKTFHQCGNADVNASYVAIKYQENCNMIHRKSARIITALLAMLITVSVVECIVSLLVLMRSKKLLRCCKRFCTLQTEVCESQYAMYQSGICAYGPSFNVSSYPDFQFDPRPLKPQVCKKAPVTAKAPSYQYKKCVVKESPYRKRPPFKAMESITESIESTEIEEEKAPITIEEEEILVRAGLLQSNDAS